MLELLHLMLCCGIQVTDAGMRQLRPHYRLTHLDLSNCQQITDDGLKQLRGMHTASCSSIFTSLAMCSFGATCTIPW